MVGQKMCASKLRFEFAGGGCFRVTQIRTVGTDEITLKAAANSEAAGNRKLGNLRCKPASSSMMCRISEFVRDADLRTFSRLSLEVASHDA